MKKITIRIYAIDFCLKHAKICVITKDIFLITFCTCFYFEKYDLY